MHNFTSATSWAAVVSAIILVAATYFAPAHEPTTLRPFASEQASVRPLATDSVQARLWQDPIEVGWKHMRAKSSSTEGSPNDQPEDLRKEWEEPDLWNEWAKAPERFHSQIDEPTGENVYFLPIVLSGEPYPESRERRLRSRYALQEIMETLEYRPRNFAKLLYFPVPLHQETGAICAPQCPDHACLRNDYFIPVTYEIFEYVGKNGQAHRQVVVLWIDNRIVTSGKAPNYRNIEFLTTYISNSVAKNRQILTLSGSDELLTLLKSVATCKNNTDCSSLPLDQKMRINYVISSAPLPQLCQELRKDDFILDIEDSAKRIVRTVPSDNYVLAAIVDELQRRIPNFGQGKGAASYTKEKNASDTNQEVWLLSEQDTFYSQVMKGAFEEILKIRNLEVTVKRIGFLKGIDGNLPNDRVDSTVETTGSINTLVDVIHLLSRSGVPKQRLFDRRQIDYLQRIAENLFHEQREKPFGQRVKAIGILGGDVYDKMLALDVFRAYFPATTYFTTDLDSAYLYGQNAAAARNLVIGSAFDLSPVQLKTNNEEEKRSPIYRPLFSFRDSYQTALYYSIMSLLIPDNERSEFQKSFNDSYRIGLFEVGRTRFEPLRVGGQSKADKRYSWNHPDSIWEEQHASSDRSMQAPFAKSFPEGEKPFSAHAWFGRFSNFGLQIEVFICAVAILAMAWGFVRYVEKRDLLPRELEASSLRLMWAVFTKAYYKHSNPSTPTSTQFLLWALGILGGVIFVVLLFFMPGWIITDFDILEPMYWVEGISAWPSILLRFSIFFFGFWMLTSSLAMSEISVNQLRAKLAGRKILAAHLDRFGAIRIRDLALIVLLTIALLQIMRFAMNNAHEYSEGFFTPGRGWLVFFGHHISLVLSLATLLVLVWWAAFRHYRCRTFLVGLNKELLKSRSAAENSSSTPSSEATSLSADEINALEGYAGVCSVTLLPPFAMMVLMVVSRHTLFDGWNIPLVLVLVLSIMLLILLVSAFQLASAAHNLKLSELNYHKIRVEPDLEKRKIAKIATVWQDAGGPFGKYKQQPIIQAIVFAAAAFGISFIEPMSRFFG